MTEEGNSNGIARVTFRVRCETLGYGENVFLHYDESPGQVGKLRAGKEEVSFDYICGGRGRGNCDDYKVVMIVKR